MKSLVVKRSVMIDGHKTSVSLEDPFWSGLKEIAHSEGATLPALLAKIDGTRERGNSSSAIRLFVLDQVRTNGMLRLTATALTCAVALTACLPTRASAWYPPPVPPPPPPIVTHGTSGAMVLVLVLQLALLALLLFWQAMICSVARLASATSCILVVLALLRKCRTAMS